MEHGCEREKASFARRATCPEGQDQTEEQSLDVILQHQQRIAWLGLLQNFTRLQQLHGVSTAPCVGSIVAYLSLRKQRTS
jgi:hypothetical protein